uniref:Uncharacterized protein n=2 Tax=Lepeophtheirus salmonis TaxID=72036 RepID=A0A0K2U7Z9_LEPSM
MVTINALETTPSMELYKHTPTNYSIYI